MGIDSTLLASASSVPLAIYTGMPESELDREFRWSKYEMTKPEKSQYEQLSGADAKRKLLSDLWRKRPAGTRDEYMTRVTYANANFGVMGREGYRSDRGRVYITYGTPDDFERHPNESDSKAYEIWTYHSLQGGAIFVFVQKNQGGEYDLVHSTLRGELQDENWQRFIQTN
jgi:GWxTD domain-containing protein